jgi:Secretion system C-terminal sorting domain
MKQITYDLTTLLIVFFLTTVLNSQNIGFTYQPTSSKDIFPTQVIELKDKKYLCVVSQLLDNPYRSVPKLVRLSESGRVLDSVLLDSPNKYLVVDKIIQTEYGFCILGSMYANRKCFFWVAKLDKNFNVVEERFEDIRQWSIQSLPYTIDRDSTIIVLVRTEAQTNGIYAKVDKTGKLTSFRILDISSTIGPNAIMVSKDNSRYYILDVINWTVLDTSFSQRLKTNIRFTDNLLDAPLIGFYHSAILKNDTTFYIAAKCAWTRSPEKDLLFSVVNNTGKAKYLKVILGNPDTSYQGALFAGVDTSKNGKYIFYGGTYNFDYNGSFLYSNLHSCFKLVKMDTNYNVIWEKRYGDDAYYVLSGLLTTSDSSVIMYGTRYDYNNIPKTDGYIIKIDGNGVVTSTTSIPLPQSSIIAYPNPSNGQLRFKKGDPSVSGTFEVNIFDISGKLVFQKKETDLSETMDLSHLATGDYIYQIKQKEQIISMGKWVKIKE